MSSRRTHWLIVCTYWFVFTANINSNMGLNCSHFSIASLFYCSDDFGGVVTQRPSTVLPLTSGCTVPDIDHGHLALESNRKVHLPEGKRLPDLSSVVYQCEPGYLLEGSEFNVCMTGNWFSSHGICTKYCPNDILRDVTFQANCERNGITVSCEDPIKPGTLAKLSCQVRYEKSTSSTPDTLLCQENGQWDHEPFQCDSLCGELVNIVIPYGERTQITFVPWHVVIYKRESRQCGGTILSAKVVISAAVCFWNSQENKFHDKSLFVIGAGKHLGDFHANDAKAQFRNISDIEVPPEFDYKSLVGDVAVVVLERPLEYTALIAPICLQWMPKQILADKTMGSIVDYGRSDENLMFTSYTFPKVESRINISGCEAAQTDMFCTANACEPEFCSTFSGSGFVVDKLEGGKVRHYIWGVATSTVGLQALKKFTNIQFYDKFVNSHLRRLKMFA